MDLKRNFINQHYLVISVAVNLNHRVVGTMSLALISMSLFSN